MREQLAGRPETQGTLLTLLARLQGNLGQLERARTLADEGLALTR